MPATLVNKKASVNQFNVLKKLLTTLYQSCVCVTLTQLSTTSATSMQWRHSAVQIQNCLVHNLATCYGT